MENLKTVLDTSALLCLLRNESGAEHVQRFISKDCGLHRLHLGEVYYAVLKLDGEEKARQMYGLLTQYPLRFLTDLSDPLLITAGNLKVKFGLGFADACAAATAIIHRAPLITKDNDFRPLQKRGFLDLIWV